MSIHFRALEILRSLVQLRRFKKQFGHNQEYMRRARKTWADVEALVDEAGA
jgi:hypothetical protein